MLCGREGPKTSFPPGGSFLKGNCIILPGRNAPGTVRKCFSHLGVVLSLTADVRSILFLTLQRICSGRRDKDIPGAAQAVALSAGPADAGVSRGLVDPVCRFRSVRLSLWVQGEKSCLLRQQMVEWTEGHFNK